MLYGLAVDPIRWSNGWTNAKPCKRALTLMTHVDFCCGLCCASCCSNENLCDPQPRQNAAATKRATNMASSATGDAILIAGVLLSSACVNECHKKANKRKRSIWTHQWIEQRGKHGGYHSLITTRKVNKQH